MKEIWKDIPGYEKSYQASNLGRIKSLARTVTKRNKFGIEYTAKYKEKILEGTAIKSRKVPYLMVFLAKGGKGNKEYIHQLVANAFIPKVDGKPSINHINFNPQDNSVSNLERCSQRDNILHTFKYDTNSKIRMREFDIVDSVTNAIVESSWCISEIARKFDTSNHTIIQRLKGIVKSPFKGYYFIYK